MSSNKLVARENSFHRDFGQYRDTLIISEKFCSGLVSMCLGRVFSEDTNTSVLSVQFSSFFSSQECQVAKNLKNKIFIIIFKCLCLRLIDYVSEKCSWTKISLSKMHITYKTLRNNNIILGIPLLEKAGMKKWGSLPEYKKYLEDVPVLIPFIKT